MASLIFLCLLSILSSGCSASASLDMPSSPNDQENANASSVTQPASIDFSGETAFSHVSEQVGFGPRYPGTEGSAQIRDYLELELESLNWDVQRQVFTFNGIDIVNIIASPPMTSDEYFVLGAHYDTRMYATEDAIDAEAPVPGANDGASGVAILLELARTMDLENLKKTPVLVFFDAEDNGGIGTWQWIMGSSYYVARLQDTPEFAIIVDMVGDSDQQIYLEATSDQEILGGIWDIAYDLGYGDFFINEIRHSMLDDHTPFIQAGIPAVDIIDFDYPYWHTTQDNLENVSPVSLERVGRTLETYIETVLVH